MLSAIDSPFLGRPFGDALSSNVPSSDGAPPRTSRKEVTASSVEREVIPYPQQSEDLTQRRRHQPPALVAMEQASVADRYISRRGLDATLPCRDNVPHPFRGRSVRQRDDVAPLGAERPHRSPVGSPGPPPAMLHLGIGRDHLCEGAENSIGDPAIEARESAGQRHS